MVCLENMLQKREHFLPTIKREISREVPNLILTTANSPNLAFDSGTPHDVKRVADVGSVIGLLYVEKCEEEMS